MRPLIVSYYVKGSPYEKEAAELKRSCEKFGWECEIAAIEDKDSWNANCCYKPEFILQCLEKFNRSLIWMDIDSVLVQNPTIFEECCADVAFRINDNVPNTSPMRMLASPMFINNSLSAKKLLSFWKKECEKLIKQDPNALDQVGLRKVVLHYPTIVEIKRLPLTYVAVTENPENRFSYHESAVIVHHELSRIYNSEMATV